MEAFAKAETKPQAFPQPGTAGGAAQLDLQHGPQLGGRRFAHRSHDINVYGGLFY